MVWRTAKDMLFHDNDRRHFTVAAGAVAEVIPDEELHQLEPVDQHAFRAMLKRYRREGLEVVVVRLAGAFRCVNWSDLEGGSRAEWAPGPVAVSRGGVRPDQDHENTPASVGFGDCPRVQRRAAAERKRA